MIKLFYSISQLNNNIIQIRVILFFFIFAVVSCTKEPEPNEPPIYRSEYFAKRTVGYMKIKGYIVDSLGNKISWKKITFKKMYLEQQADSNNIGFYTCSYFNNLDKFYSEKPHVLEADSIITNTDTLKGVVNIDTCENSVYYGSVEIGYLYTIDIVAR
jgi:hypothetical protein